MGTVLCEPYPFLLGEIDGKEVPGKEFYKESAEKYKKKQEVFSCNGRMVAGEGSEGKIGEITKVFTENLLTIPEKCL